MEARENANDVVAARGDVGQKESSGYFLESRNWIFKPENLSMIKAGSDKKEISLSLFLGCTDEPKNGMYYTYIYTTLSVRVV